jgi:hypothetical protein
MNTYLAGWMAAGALVSALSTLGAAPANALLIEGNSNNSTFSDLSCTGTGCASSLTSAQITLGSTASGGQKSTLEILNTSFSATEDTLGLVIAQLELTAGNKPGKDQGTLAFNYLLQLAFPTSPDSASQLFNLGLSGNAGAGAAAAVTVTGLSPFAAESLVFPTFTLANFRFDEIGPGAFANGTWTASGNDRLSTLRLLADLTLTPGNTGQVEAAVPAPTTLALFCLGLLLLGFSGRRLQSRA